MPETLQSSGEQSGAESLTTLPGMTKDYLSFYKQYCFDNPITSSIYFALIILVSALLTYKCKGGLKRLCSRRR